MWRTTVVLIAVTVVAGGICARPVAAQTDRIEEMRQESQQRIDEMNAESERRMQEMRDHAGSVHGENATNADDTGGFDIRRYKRLIRWGIGLLVVGGIGAWKMMSSKSA